MFESKYSNFLTVILVIVIVAIIGLLGYLGYNLYSKYFISKDSAEFVDAFVSAETDDSNTENQTNTENQSETTNIIDEIIETSPSTSEASSAESKKKTFKGFTVAGTIEIPKTNLKYPILEELSPKSLETSVIMLYGSGLNQVGNTLIIGHNYRNGLFFSNNKKLSTGDKIYITDEKGNRVSYTIYDKFETTAEDTDFITRVTNGLREISLSTCTDDSSARLIILARADS